MIKAALLNHNRSAGAPLGPKIGVFILREGRSMLGAFSADGKAVRDLLAQHGQRVKC